MAQQNEHKRAEELISAYLDRRVSAEEQAFFERHIASCTNCRAQLEATRSMVAALQVMPVVKAPRSFVLPREMGKQPKRSFLPLYPALRLATVIAALAFVVLFAGDLLISRSSGASAPQSIPAVAPAPLAMQASAAPRAAAPTTEPAATEAANAAGAAAAAEPAAPMAGAAKAGAAVTITQSAAMSMPTAAPEAAAPADAAQLAPKTLRATPEPTQPALVQQAAPAAEQPAQPNRAVTTLTIDPLRIIEIVLLVLAIALGIATLVARRKQA